MEYGVRFLRIEMFRQQRLQMLFEDGLDVVDANAETDQPFCEDVAMLKMEDRSIRFKREKKAAYLCDSHVVAG